MHTRRFYNRYSLVLLNHAYRMTGDREEAKDIVHEVFSALWEHRPHLREESHLSAFLLYLRAQSGTQSNCPSRCQSKYAEYVLHFAVQQEQPTDCRIRKKQLAERIEKEIAHLPPQNAGSLPPEQEARPLA